MKFVPIALYALAWILAWIAKSHYQYFTEALFLFTLLTAVGIRQLIAFVNNRFFPENAAKISGQPVGLYQKKSACINLALGAAGVLSYYQPIFSFGTALIATIFFLGLAFNRFEQIKTNSQQTLKDALPMILADLLIALTLLYCFWHMHQVTKIL
jgi:hypothetical protein